MSEPEIVFTLARGQNAFFAELADALCFELNRIGARARVMTGELPEPNDDTVHVLLPPHEFVTLSGFHPPPALLRRCILVSGEQPESEFFEPNARLARHAGAVFDINARGVRAYHGRGIKATHLQLGYTEAWDGHGLVPARDIDVLFLGRHTDRRANALASYADSFERFRCHFVLSDNSRPNTGSGPGFVGGEDKRRLLARSKVLLSIHGEDEPYFEWLRVAEAICSGCVVVSEHSTDTEPLRWGEHLLTGRLETLGLLAATVVDDDGMRARISADARAHLRAEAPLSAAAEKLRDGARKLAAKAVTPAAVHAARVGRMSMAATQPFEKPLQPPKVGFSAGETLALRAIKQQLQQLTLIRRQLAADRVGHAAGTVTTHLSRGWSFGRAPAVTVIVPVYNHAGSLRYSLDSVLRSEYRDWELVVVDDGSTDGSGDIARRWSEEHPYRRCVVLRHEVNRGLPAARNTGASYARADKLLMLDSDNALRPHAIGRLVAALDDDPGASFAYGILDRFSDGGPEGLLSYIGWAPQRLRMMNYIDALSLIRRSALLDMGGYTEDSRLMGWEDYDLWVRFAEAGLRGAFVPEMIARYRAGHSSMISITNLSLTDAFAALVEHAPKLMADLEIPGT
jgi:hypothetical protein